MNAFWQDIRYGVRQVRLAPLFALVCIASLALGIGANTAIFQLIDGIRLRTIPAEKPQQLVTVKIADRSWASGDFSGDYPNLSYPIWQEIQQRQNALSPIAAWGSTTFNLAVGGEVQYARGIWVSGDFFNVLGLKPYLGRLITPADDTVGCATGPLNISYSFWKRQYGADESVIGKKITLDGFPFFLAGVTPPGFYGVSIGDYFDVAVPLCAEAIDNGEDSRIKVRRAWWLASIGRLKPRATIQQSTAELKVISPTIMQETIPEQYNADGVKHYLAYQLAAFPAANGFSQLREDSATPLWILIGISGLVLLIACANIANLLLARSASREREIAVRLALGASRWRVARQLLSESLLLASLGAICGGFLASALSQALVAFLNTPRNPVFVDLKFDWRVLGFTTGLICLTTIFFGLVPALRATRTAPIETLKAGGRGMTASRERFGLRRALVVSQVALSFVLLVGALLFARSLKNLLTLDAGFRQDGVLIANVDYTRLKISKDLRTNFDGTLVEHLRAIPGVESASAARVTPLNGNSTNDAVLGETTDESRGSTWENHVSPRYFQTLGTPILAGRDFTEADTATSPKVAIVNQTFVRKFFNSQNPLGKTFRIQQFKGEAIPVFEVVGVVKDAVYTNLHGEFPPTVYYPLAQEARPYSGIGLVMKSQLALPELMRSVKSTIGNVSPDIDIDFRVFSDQVRETMLPDELMATLSGFFGILAVLLAAVGLYGVLSYTVTQRKSEIGVRLALGAQRSDVLRMVLYEAGILVAIGLIAGAAMGAVAAKGASSLLFGLKPRDPLTFVVSFVALAIIGVLASFIPAWRAATVDPWTALRDE